MSIKIKFIFSETCDVHTIYVQSDITCQALYKKVFELFSFPSECTMKLFYIDQDNDYVSISTTDDLKAAFDLAKLKNPLKVFISPLLPYAEESCCSSTSSSSESCGKSLCHQESSRKKKIIEDYNSSKASTLPLTLNTESFSSNVTTCVSPLYSPPCGSVNFSWAPLFKLFSQYLSSLPSSTCCSSPDCKSIGSCKCGANFSQFPINSLSSLLQQFLNSYSSSSASSQPLHAIFTSFKPLLKNILTNNASFKDNSGASLESLISTVLSSLGQIQNNQVKDSNNNEGSSSSKIPSSVPSLLSNLSNLLNASNNNIISNNENEEKKEEEKKEEKEEGREKKEDTHKVRNIPIHSEDEKKEKEQETSSSSSTSSSSQQYQPNFCSNIPQLIQLLSSLCNNNNNNTNTNTNTNNFGQLFTQFQPLIQQFLQSFSTSSNNCSSNQSYGSSSSFSPSSSSSSSSIPSFNNSSSSPFSSKSEAKEEEEEVDEDELAFAIAESIQSEKEHKESINSSKKEEDEKKEEKVEKREKNEETKEREEKIDVEPSEVTKESIELDQNKEDIKEENGQSSTIKN